MWLRTKGKCEASYLESESWILCGEASYRKREKGTPPAPARQTWRLMSHWGTGRWATNSPAPCEYGLINFKFWPIKLMTPCVMRTLRRSPGGQSIISMSWGRKVGTEGFSSLCISSSQQRLKTIVETPPLLLTDWILQPKWLKIFLEQNPPLSKNINVTNCIFIPNS